MTSTKMLGMRSTEIPEVAWPRPLPVVQANFLGSKETDRPI